MSKLQQDELKLNVPGDQNENSQDRIICLNQKFSPLHAQIEHSIERAEQAQDLLDREQAKQRAHIAFGAVWPIQDEVKRIKDERKSIGDEILMIMDEIKTTHANLHVTRRSM